MDEPVGFATGDSFQRENDVTKLNDVASGWDWAVGQKASSGERGALIRRFPNVQGPGGASGIWSLMFVNASSNSLGWGSLSNV